MAQSVQPQTRSEELPAAPSNGASPPNGRTSERNHLPAREYYRTMARPDPAPTGRLKYHIDKGDYVPTCDHVWVPTKINGMESGQLDYYTDRGWVAARAMDFPKLSGFGKEYSEALRRSGYRPEVQPDDVIEIDGQMLMLRAEELSIKAEQERLRAAHELVDVQMQRLEMASRKSLGSKAADLMKVQYGKQYVSPDSFDAEVGGREV